MFNELDRQKAVQAAHFKQETERGLAEIFHKFETLVACEANTRAITQACNIYCGQEVAPTLGIFQQLLEDNPELWGQLATREVSRTRALLVEQIISILAAKGKAHDAFSLRSEEKRLSTFTLEALHTRLADLQRAARMAVQPMSQLKQIVQDARPVPGYPALPRQVYEDGVYKAVNANYLRALDVFSLKRLMRIHGPDAVNRRLAEG